MMAPASAITWFGSGKYMVALALLVAACVPTRPDAATVEFVIVRHAEKGDDPRDPSLNGAGRVRAQRLATALASTPLAAAYASEFRRTRETAMPAAAAHGLSVSSYDASSDAGEFAALLRRRHPRGTVLIVGHSNTVPSIAAALCGCAVAPLGEGEYDRRLRVLVDREGNATLIDTRTP